MEPTEDRSEPSTGIPPGREGEKAHETRARERWWGPFLERLRACRSPTAAAESVGMTRSAAYKYRDANPDFGRAWDDAMEAALDDLESTHFTDLMDGIPSEVVSDGQLVTVRRVDAKARMEYLGRTRDRLHPRREVKHTGEVLHRKKVIIEDRRNPLPDPDPHDEAADEAAEESE